MTAPAIRGPRRRFRARADCPALWFVPLSFMFVFFLVFMVALAVTMWGRNRFQKVYQAEAGNFISSGVTGAELAEKVVAARRIEGVSVVKGRGLLADFYRPEKKQVTLAPKHFNGSDFSSLAMAALQAGKAIQHYEGHRPLLWRTTAIRWTVYLSLPLLVIGLVTLGLGMAKTLFPAVLLVWSVVALWNVATVPTDLDAVERAKKQLDSIRAFRNLDERVGVERVMGAASTAYLDGLHTVISWAGRKVLPWARRHVQPE